MSAATLPHWHACTSAAMLAEVEEPTRVVWHGFVDMHEYQLLRMRKMLALQMKLPSGQWAFTSDNYRWHRVMEQAVMDFTS
jgi:hypothetical protein